MKRKRDRKSWLWTGVVIMYTAFIFSNSMTPADESSRQSGAVMIMVLNLIDMLGLEGSWVTEHLIRKSAHFAEYALFGVLLWNCLGTYRWNVGAVRTKLLCQGWLGTMIPLMDETIQLFTEGRSGQVSDVWLDMAGVLAGTCVMILVKWICGKSAR